MWVMTRRRSGLKRKEESELERTEESEGQK
jgi:hypothetical protein